MIGTDERKHPLLYFNRDDISMFEVSPNARLAVFENDNAVFVEGNQLAGRDRFFAIGKKYGDASARYIRVGRRGDDSVGRFEIPLITDNKAIVSP